MASNRFLQIVGVFLLGGTIAGGGACVIYLMSDATNPKPPKPVVKAAPKPEPPARVPPSKKETFLFKRESNPATPEKVESNVEDLAPKQDLKAKQRELENLEWDRITAALKR